MSKFKVGDIVCHNLMSEYTLEITKVTDRNYEYIHGKQFPSSKKEGTSFIKNLDNAYRKLTKLEKALK